jgi:arylsulfatase
MLEDDTIIHPEGAETGDFYYTDAISDRAVSMIEGAAQEDDPFFMYVAYTAPHWPLQALPEDVARYEGRYRKGGWDALRTARHEEMKGTGLVSEKWEISPRDEQAPPWQEVDNPDWEDVRMAVYAAQIDRMDQGIGRILDKLRALDLEDNTLVMFLADNGGCAEFLQEDGWSQRYATQTPDGTPIATGNIPGVRPGGPDTFMSYDLPWANASNAPFRLYKHWVHEGGISTPFIVQWPSVIDEPRIEHTVAHAVDFMATCLDAAGVPYPEAYEGRAITPLEGESLVPALESSGWQRERPVFWEHEGNRAVREGRWKLVSKYPGDWELYDMVRDRTELNDLRGVNQPQVDAMVARYRAWAARCGVRDWPVEPRR